MGGQCCRSLTVPVPKAVLVPLVRLLEGVPGEASVGLHIAVLVHHSGLINHVVDKEDLLN